MLLVFSGGGLGSAARYGFGLQALRLVGSGYPWGTFAINVLGAFLIGVVTETFALKAGLSQPLRLFLPPRILAGSRPSPPTR